MSAPSVALTARRLRMLGSLLFFATLALLPFFSHYVQASFAGREGTPYGVWVGEVSLSTLTRGEFGGEGESGAADRAVIMLSVKPVVFSYLGEDTVEAELTDRQGKRLVFEVFSLRDDWRVPWSGDPNHLLAGPPVDILVGSWNESMTPFVLTVTSRYPFPKAHPLSDHVTFRITGTLAKANRDAYRKLLLAQHSEYASDGT